MCESEGRTRVPRLGELAGDQHLGLLELAPVMPPVKKTALHRTAGHPRNLCNRPAQGMTVIGVARLRQHAHHEIVPIGGRHADLDPKFVLLARLALGNTLHLRRVQACPYPAFFASTAVQLGRAQHETPSADLAGLQSCAQYHEPPGPNRSSTA